MKGLLAYRIISYILLPVAGLFAFIDVFALLAALAQPALLLGVFMILAVCIYTVTSFIFLTKGIDANKPLKTSLKDWIKVNAYVSLGFAALSLIQGFTALQHPEVLKKAIDMMAAQQNVPSSYSADIFLTATKGILYFMVCLSALLIVHITISFKLIKTQAHLFSKES
jgi:hypothetical protein